GKPKKVVKGKYPAIGADVIRWLYCRSNPAQNIHFGPVSADELRSRFLIKLWNSYSFFCELAEGENFDPTAAQVPMANRPDMDRWILSELQRLISVARRAFGAYDVQSFCLEAERFLDDNLSNWYIRRSKRRFWETEPSDGKQAAFQTLYGVLVTLTKLFAPVMPFVTEAMYQHLVVRGAGSGPPSVHLCDYPTADESLIDQALSDNMASLR